MRSNEHRVRLAQPVYAAPFGFQIWGRPEVLQFDETAIPEFSHFREYGQHVDLAGLRFKAAGMVRDLDDFDQIPIALHMAEQIAVHALDVRCIKDHSGGSVTGRACDLAAFAEVIEEHARQRSCVRRFET